VMPKQPVFPGTPVLSRIVFRALKKSSQVQSACGSAPAFRQAFLSITSAMVLEPTGIPSCLPSTSPTLATPARKLSGFGLPASIRGLRSSRTPLLPYFRRNVTVF
jgi:hypothetical protein